MKKVKTLNQEGLVQRVFAQKDICSKFRCMANDIFHGLRSSVSECWISNVLHLFCYIVTLCDDLYVVPKFWVTTALHNSSTTNCVIRNLKCEIQYDGVERRTHVLFVISLISLVTILVMQSIKNRYTTYVFATPKELGKHLTRVLFLGWIQENLPQHDQGANGGSLHQVWQRWDRKN